MDAHVCRDCGCFIALPSTEPTRKETLMHALRTAAHDVLRTLPHDDLPWPDEVQQRHAEALNRMQAALTALDAGPRKVETGPVPGPVARLLDRMSRR